MNIVSQNSKSNATSSVVLLDAMSFHFYLSMLMFSFINLLLLLLSLFLIDGRVFIKSRLSYLFFLFDKYLLVSGSAYIVNLYLKKG